MESKKSIIRLDKYLADMGIGSRTDVKKYIRQGRIKVQEKTVKKPEFKVNLETDEVCFDETCISYKKYEYYMLNKPAGVISATHDEKDRTVLDLITGKTRKDLFPVGRLDKDTEGLLLITNDGELSHKLLSPKHHVDKCYYAKIKGVVTQEDVLLFQRGLNIGTKEHPEFTLPGKLEIIKSDLESEIRLTIQEGKFHQVKRMFQAVGKEVVYLKRLSMGTLRLDENLKKGEYRPLTKEELERLC